MNQDGPPGTLTAEIYAPVRGQSFDIVVSGGPANAPAAVMVSSNTGTQVACPPRMAPDCLGLMAPAKALAFADLSATGDHTFSVAVPADLAFDEVTLQAVAIDGTGNYLSAPTTVPVFETEPATVEVRFTYFGTFPAVPIAGADVQAATTTLRSGLATDITDADGTIVVGVTPDEPYDIVFSEPGFRDFHVVGYSDAPGTSYSAGWSIPNNLTLDTLQAALGVPLDPTQGTVIVSVHDHTGGSHLGLLAGATVALDVPYLLPLAGDLTQPTGLGVGTTTTSEGSVYFINAAAGTATPTVTPPAGYTCSVIPAGPQSMATTVHADAFTLISFGCTQ